MIKDESGDSYLFGRPIIEAGDTLGEAVKQRPIVLDDLRVYTAPIAIIKAGDPDGRSQALLDWCREQGIEPNDTYQLVFDLSAMMVTAYQYERNEAGRLVGRGGGVATREPFTQAITTLPLVKAVQQARQ